MMCQIYHNYLSLIENTHLVRLETGITEHSDLIGDVRPVTSAAVLFQIVAQLCANRNDAISHPLHVAQPLHSQLWITQDLTNDASSIDRRVRVHRPD